MMASGADGSAVPFYFVLATVGIIGVSLWASYVADRRRNGALQTVAQTMGFAYTERCSDTELGSVGGVSHLFNSGHRRIGKRMLTGKLGDRDCRIVDYQYTTGSGKSAHIHRQTVLILDQAGTALPDFTLSPENVFHRLAEIFGYQDLDFDAYPDFSKHYLLRGKDEAAIRKTFTSDILTLLGGTTGWSVESAGGRLMVFREGNFAEPAKIPSYAAEGLRIANALKT